MAMKITASEIYRQSEKLDSQLNTYIEQQQEIINALNDLQQLTESADSDLAPSLGTLKECMGSIKVKIQIGFNELKEAMVKYSNETIANEERHSGEVTETTTSLNELLSDIKNINIHSM